LLPKPDFDLAQKEALKSGENSVIPAFNSSGVLPPFLGPKSTDATMVSPYKATILDFTTRFANTSARRTILRGLLNHRDALRGIGFVDGYQWFDGSFCTDVENTEKRDPNDVDVVTYAYRPAHSISDIDFKNLRDANLHLLSTRITKPQFKVDFYLVDLNLKPHIIVERASYWHGVFGHKRVTSLWKGMVRINLVCNDQDARQHLDDLDAQERAAQAASAATITGTGAGNA
jgi:hypothetical protein